MQTLATNTHATANTTTVFNFSFHSLMGPRQLSTTATALRTAGAKQVGSSGLRLPLRTPNMISDDVALPYLAIQAETPAKRGNQKEAETRQALVITTQAAATGVGVGASIEPRVGCPRSIS
jgi:hypothetical protein